MNKQHIVTRIAVGLNIISILLMIGSFLALHDISRDYLSPRALMERAQLTSGSLPIWTECTLEWDFLEVGFWVVLLFQLIFLAIFLWFVKNHSRESIYQTIKSSDKEY